MDGVIAICWDVGGQLGLRTLWSNYFDEVDGVIFVMDSSDHERLDESVRAFESVTSHVGVSSKPILFLANKNDLENLVSIEEILKSFKLKENNLKIQIEPVSARSGSGLESGIKWVMKEAAIYNEIRKK